MVVGNGHHTLLRSAARRAQHCFSLQRAILAGGDFVVINQDCFPANVGGVCASLRERLTGEYTYQANGERERVLHCVTKCRLSASSYQAATACARSAQTSLKSLSD